MGYNNPIRDTFYKSNYQEVLMPIPPKKKGESVSSYRSKVIETEIKHGKPPKQAEAIGYAKAGEGKKKKK